MANLAGVVQLLKKEHGRLTKELQGISAALAAFGKTYGKQTGTRGRLSAAARARIAAAQRARWAKVNASKSQKGGQEGGVDVLTCPSLLDATLVLPLRSLYQWCAIQTATSLLILAPATLALSLCKR
jgi:hypothetical protein